MDKTKGAGSVIRIIIYVILITACVVLFIIFGKKQKKTDYKPDEEKPVEQDEAVPAPALCSEIETALEKNITYCRLSEPVINEDGNIKYELVFENEKDEGCIIIKPDKDFRAVRCEIQLSYFYDGIPPEGEINKVLEQEYKRREKLHKALIEEYLSTVIPVLDYKDSVNSADILSITDAVIKSYMTTKQDARDYDRSYGVLRFNTHKGKTDFRGNFIIVISVKENKS